MSVSYNAAQEAIRIANDNSHGYDQGNRWGNPDYDCSALVIDLFKKQGVPLTCTYTGDMFGDMLAHGFKNVTNSINLNTWVGLKVGDVLLNVANHAAIYVGNGQIVQASINEKGSVRGGQPGDQTGNEIAVKPYYNFPWNYVLRYAEKDSSIPVVPGANTSQNSSTSNSSSEIQNGMYTVKQGDTLWSIAEKFYHDGTKFAQIMKDNGLLSDRIKVGMQLKIGSSSVDKEPAKTGATATTCTPKLPILKYGENSIRVRRLQSLLVSSGYSLTIDGDFGSETQDVIKLLQKINHIPITGVVDAKTYEALLS